jgi:hypothetical protein
MKETKPLLQPPPSGPHTLTGLPDARIVEALHLLAGNLQVMLGAIESREIAARTKAVVEQALARLVKAYGVSMDSTELSASLRQLAILAPDDLVELADLAQRLASRLKKAGVIA